MYRFWLPCMSIVFMAALPIGRDNNARALDLDLDAIFRCTAEDAGLVKSCRDARGLIMTNCTVCHSFVQIVKQQFKPEGWELASCPSCRWRTSSEPKSGAGQSDPGIPRRHLQR